MATHQQEIKTPVVDTIQSPAHNNVMDHGHYQYQPDSTFKVDVAANSQDVLKEENEKASRSRKAADFVILGIVVVLLVVLILIAWFVIVKAVFQHNVNKIKMSVNYLDINKSTTKPLYPLLYDGSTFATFEFPALTIDKGEQSYDLNITSDLIVTDADVFSSMSTAVMDDVAVVFDTTAKVKAHALGFSYGGLDFKRELSIEGFDNFRDPLTVIDHIDFWGCTDAGWTMDIDVNVTNISQMGLNGIGYLNLTLYVEQDYLGYLSGMTPEVGVPRGLSQQTFRLFVDIDNHSNMVKMVTALIDNYVQYFIPVRVRRLAVMNMSIIYTDSTRRIDLNSSCDLVTLLTE
ncbi:Protein of unknown function DUF3712 [Phytophthora cactorum]|nr:Protein of unknown function DUF3712 [Phytophthora cactorum]